MSSTLLLQGLATALLNGAFAWLVGALAECLWLDRIQATWAREAATALRRSVPMGAGVALLSHLVAIWCAAAQMADSPLLEAGAAFGTMLLKTGFGRYGSAAALVMALVLAVAVVGVARPLPSRAGGVALALLLPAFAFARSALSHAGEHGAASVGFVMEWLHLMLIALWVGSVAVAAWLVLPRARATMRGSPGVAGYLRVLSHAATLAVVGIAASGVFSVWARVGSVDHLSGNTYVTVLAVKLALVASAGMLGAFNRFIGFPRDSAVDRISIRTLNVIRVEAVILLMVLISAAFLVVQQPPNGL